jgi:hypothetical protein
MVQIDPFNDDEHKVGRNVRVPPLRWVAGNLDKARSYAEELIGLPSDLILCASTAKCGGARAHLGRAALGQRAYVNARSILPSRCSTRKLAPKQRPTIQALTVRTLIQSSHLIGQWGY